MSKGRARTVYHRRSSGKWVNQRNDLQKPTGVYSTQQKAIVEATRCLMIEGGGELTVIGADNVIRSRDTVPPGTDPFPPRDVD